MLQLNIRSYAKSFDSNLASINCFDSVFNLIILTEGWLKEDEVGEFLRHCEFIRTTHRENQNDRIVISEKSELSVTGV